MIVIMFILSHELFKIYSTVEVSLKCVCWLNDSVKSTVVHKCLLIIDGYK